VYSEYFVSSSCDLGVNLRQSFRIGGMKIPALPGLCHLPQQVKVDAKLTGHQNPVSEFVFLGHGNQAAAADADRIEPDPRFRRDSCRLAWVDDPGIAIAVGEQYEHFALRFRPAQAVDPHRNAVADRCRQFLLQPLGIDDPPLAVADRLGNFEPVHDRDQSSVIEGQGTFAVGEPPEGDEPDQIINPALQSARPRPEHEFRNDMLDSVEPADVSAVELKVDGLHRAGNVEHDLDGDSLAADPCFRLPRLRPGQAGYHQA